MAKKTSTSVQLRRARTALASRRVAQRELQGQLFGKAALVATSAATAKIEEVVPQEILSIPVKIWLGAVAYLLAFSMGKSQWSRVLEGIGDAQLAVYCYRVAENLQAGKSRPFIAGSGIEFEE